MGLPAGMTSRTYDYLLSFTMAHEGATPFMYNNWPLKNANRDVTVGVGIAVTSEDHAAQPDIRSLFVVKGTGAPASEPDMRAEFRRVYDLPRTGTNLFSDYQGRSPLEIPDDRMRRSLNDKMLSFWSQNGASLPTFGSIPAQAQVALVSYNYGARLRTAPKMCAAVRAGDYTVAARESFVSIWDGQKNEAHKRLFTNAATLVDEGLDTEMLPPAIGPFKPPPLISGGANPPLSSPVGRWNVRVPPWFWIYDFTENGVRWTDPYNQMTGTGTWRMVSDSILISWGSGSRDRWDAPVTAAKTKGSCFVTGSGTYPLTAVKQD
jgi:hypothetical protein